MDDKTFYDNAKIIYEYCIRNGLTKEQACGIVAQAEVESGFSIKAMGDNGHAFGLFQWHRDRINLIKEGCGVDITTFPPIEEQMKAVWWELNNSEHHALNMIKKAKTAYEAGEIACKYYERPAASGQQIIRANKAQKWLDYFKGSFS